jgi:TonB family protein
MRAITRLAGVGVVAGICLLAALLGAARTRENEGGTATEELRSLMTTAMAAARAGDQAKLEEIARNLIIPDYELWFKAMFGEEGAKLGEAYGSRLDETEKQYPKLFEWLAKQEGELVIEDLKTLPKRSDNWCGQTLANALQGDVVLYRVSVGAGDSTGLKSGRVAGYFVLVGGAYRRLDCQLLGLRPEAGGVAGSSPLRIAANVQAAKIIKRIQPEYPEDARRTRISGTVRLHAVIGKDGGIKELEVVSGHPMLKDAAVNAVKQWRYQPTLINGEPVDMDKTIDVIFALNCNPPMPHEGPVRPW